MHSSDGNGKISVFRALLHLHCPPNSLSEPARAQSLIAKQLSLYFFKSEFSLLARVHSFSKPEK